MCDRCCGLMEEENICEELNEMVCSNQNSCGGNSSGCGNNSNGCGNSCNRCGNSCNRCGNCCPRRCCL